MARPFVWSKDREARLIKAWNHGVAASALAERFGVSEKSILQKIHTLRAAGIELRMGESAIGAR
ncbi:hypothetical protein Msil_2177 [Methylocella silvestris BL2]|uniref:Helix-turn-helix type 11 domain-containing protein n=1 Tax=Methylocella silvestris (strain DSM 15510 / CIP 108128 / LMG 27833 / NCIMB 13906 / BL2) TaxID=395965 RepID=B8ESX7_METSB|nr:HTH domain-containing protein [Methylocella silvestris]ACK51115.1 hypothetical protein Msil_2177 [Methylocella silvestris BL2]